MDNKFRCEFEFSIQYSNSTIPFHSSNDSQQPRDHTLWPLMTQICLEEGIVCHFIASKEMAKLLTTKLGHGLGCENPERGMIGDSSEGTGEILKIGWNWNWKK